MLLVVVPAILAASAGGHWGWLETGGRWFNVVLLLGILAYFLRAPFQQYFADRKRGIQEEIILAGKALQEAEAKLAAVEERVKGLDQELETMRKATAEEAELERCRITDGVQKDVSRITLRAKMEIQGLIRLARKELESHAAELVVELARQRLQQEMTSQQNARAVDRMVERLHSRH